MVFTQQSPDPPHVNRTSELAKTLHSVARRVATQEHKPMRVQPVTADPTDKPDGTTWIRSDQTPPAMYFASGGQTYGVGATSQLTQYFSFFKSSSSIDATTSSSFVTWFSLNAVPVPTFAVAAFMQLTISGVLGSNANSEYHIQVQFAGQSSDANVRFSAPESTNQFRRFTIATNMYFPSPNSGQQTPTVFAARVLGTGFITVDGESNAGAVISFPSYQ
jgi:hypothetical protein